MTKAKAERDFFNLIPAETEARLRLVILHLEYIFITILKKKLQD